MPMPDGTLTDYECRVELLKLAKYLDENFLAEVKANPTALPSELAIKLLTSPVCAGCGKPFPPYGPLCVRCQ